MNFFQLILKQMRQRSLSTWLTLLSVLLGVSLAIAIMILRREGQNLFAQTDFGYDILIGPPKGSPLQLTLNTVYHMDVSPGVIPYQIYEDMSRKAPPLPGHPDYRPYVRIAVPFMVGDSYKGRRIVGTSPQMFGVDDGGKPVEGAAFQYRKDKGYELAQGRVFAPRKFEAVIGSEVAEKLHLHLYDEKLSDQENEQQGGAFRATHGMPRPDETPDIHKPVWRIVGILKPTHTANDRVLFVPYISLYAITEHEGGMIDQALLKANIDPSRIPPGRLDEVLSKLGIDPKKVPESVRKKFKMRAATTSAPASSKEVGELMKDAAVAPTTQAETPGQDIDPFHLDEQGNIVPDLPPDEWALSAILVQSRGSLQGQQLIYNFKVIDDRATGVSPAIEMRKFFETFLSGSSTVLLLISLFVTVVAAASIMTTIYNSVSARLREIAILRALGATRARILAMITGEAMLIGLIGGILGLLVGHLLSAAGSTYLQQTIGEGINWLSTDRWEWLYLVAVVILAFLAGLVPALKAYRTPVATNLVAV
jgi:putative ABC transport system permease protein